MAEKIYIEVELDDKGVTSKLITLDRNSSLPNSRTGAANLTLLEGAMMKASAVGTILGNAIYNLGVRAIQAFIDGVKGAIDASNQFQNAFIGLTTIASKFGISANDAKAAAMALSEDGLMTVADSAAGLKNLLSAGFGLPQAISLMNGFKDSAAFNRQAALGFGQAIVGATEGIKNQMSQLIDNAGLTKNYSVIVREAGLRIEDMARISSDANVRNKVFAGLMKELSLFTGDAAKMVQTYQGALSKLSTQWVLLQAQWGDAITQNQTLITLFNLVADEIKGVRNEADQTGSAFTVISHIVIGFIKALDLTLAVASGVRTAFYYVIATVDELARKFQSTILESREFTLSMAEMIGSLPGGAKILNTLGISLDEMRAKTEESRQVQNGLRLEVEKNVLAAHDETNAIDRTRDAIGRILPELEKTIGKQTEVKSTTEGVARAQETAVDSAAKYAKSMGDLATSLEGFHRLTDTDFAKEFGNQLENAERETVKLGKSLDTLPDVIEEALERLRTIKIAEIMGDHAKSMTEEMEKIGKGWAESTERYAKQSQSAMENGLRAWVDADKSASEEVARRSMTSHEFEIYQIQRDGEEKKKALDQHSAFYTQAMEAIERETAAKMASARAAHNREINEMKKGVTSWANSFRDIATGLPSLLIDAFTGGGDWKGVGDAIASQIGVAITSNLFAAGGALNGLANSMTKGMSDLFGNAIGDAFALALPGIGSLLGPLISKAFSAIAGLFGDKEHEKVNDMRDSFVEAAGGLHELNVQAQGAGLTLDRLLKAKTVQEYEAAVAELEGAFERVADETKAAAEETARLKEVFDRYKVSWTDFTGPERMRRMGEEVARIQDDFRTLTEDIGVDSTAAVILMKDEIIEMSLAAVKAGEGIPAAFAPWLKQLAEGGHLTEELAAELLGLTTKAVPALKDIEDAAKRYGMTIADLGKGAKQIWSDETASQMVKDFQMFIELGTPVETLIRGMGDEVQAFVTKTLQWGTAVPESMRPLLQAMVDSGALVDENKNKLTDLSRFEFTKPLATAVDDLIKKLDELILTLTNGVVPAVGGIGSAASNIPDNPFRNWRVPPEALGFSGGGGGGSSADGVPVPAGSGGDGGTFFIGSDGRPVADGNDGSRHGAFDLGNPGVQSFLANNPGDLDRAMRIWEEHGWPGFLSRGGLVGSGGLAGRAMTLYASNGAFVPRGSDVVPAMLTPGEGILSRDAMRRLGKSGLDALNNGSGSGGMGSGLVVQVGDVSVQVGEDVDENDIVERVGRAIVRKMQRQGVRFNRAS